MPFYPALPEYKSLDVAGSIGAGLQLPFQLQYTAMRSAAMKEAVEAERNKRTALQQYQATGDPRTLYPALTPEQALEAPGKLQAHQLGLGIKASDFFTNITPSLTWETYPKIRQDAISQFPNIGEMHFPAPEQLGGPEGFEKWREDKLNRIATFNSMPEVIKARARMQLEEYKARRKESLEREKMASEERRTSEIAASRTAAARIRANKPATEKTPTPFSTFLKDPKIAELPPSEQVKRYNEQYATSRETPVQATTRKGKEASQQIKEELAGALGIKKPAAATEVKPNAQGLYPMTNKRTGKTDLLTKEEYDQVIKMRGGK